MKVWCILGTMRGILGHNGSRFGVLAFRVIHERKNEKGNVTRGEKDNWHYVILCRDVKQTSGMC